MGSLPPCRPPRSVSGRGSLLTTKGEVSMSETLEELKRRVAELKTAKESSPNSTEESVTLGRPIEYWPPSPEDTGECPLTDPGYGDDKPGPRREPVRSMLRRAIGV